MFVSLRIVTLPADRSGDAARLAEVLAAAAPALAGVRTGWAAPVGPAATLNAGHLVWRLVHDTEAQALALPLDPMWRSTIAPALAGAQVATVGYRLGRSGPERAGSGAEKAGSGTAGGGAGVWRALVFAVMPHSPPEQVRALEAATLRMPRHVRAIRAWALSPVSFSEGPKRFSHVWEQEFDDLAGLTGPYMTDPVHWGMVDAYFDAEYPEYIVDPHLIQVVGSIQGGVIAGSGP